MSQGPSTFGTMITSSTSPISVTSWVRSSRTHGLSSELTRVHSEVSPKSDSFAARIKPSRAASLLSAGIASSRLPSRMSVLAAMSGALAAIFSFEKSRKWIILEGPNGISRGGSGAPIASGLKKSLGLRKERSGVGGRGGSGGGEIYSLGPGANQGPNRGLDRPRPPRRGRWRARVHRANPRRAGGEDRRGRHARARLGGRLGGCRGGNAADRRDHRARERAGDRSRRRGPRDRKSTRLNSSHR